MARGARLTFGLLLSAALLMPMRSEGHVPVIERAAQTRLDVRGSVVRPNARAARNVNVSLYQVGADAREVVGTMVTDRRGAFSFTAPVSRRYLVVASLGDERGEVGPFELTEATAPVLVVLRRKD